MAFVAVVVAMKRRMRKGCSFLVVWVVIDVWPGYLRIARQGMDDVGDYGCWPCGCDGDVGADDSACCSHSNSGWWWEENAQYLNFHLTIPVVASILRFVAIISAAFVPRYLRIFRPWCDPARLIG